MYDDPTSTPGGRFLLTIEMAELGIRLMRENLRKRYPGDTDEQQDERMARWMEGPDPSWPGLRVTRCAK